MKLLFVPALLLAFSVSAPGEEPPSSDPAKKKDCPLCKLPGRAALFAGAARACPPECAKLCCKGTAVTFMIEGLVDDQGASKVTAALNKIDGVEVQDVSHQSGSADLRYDPAKVTPVRLITTIGTCGYKVTGERASFKVSGLNDDQGASTVEKALVPIKGVHRIETVCHRSGTAIVTFDPIRTDRSRIAAAINTTKYKVQVR